ncbi:MAG: potassium/proton antiporter [Oscillospiraceae bacterium]|nr:potassium/proton antiporter [Oscillospiraceae bacterium]
MNIIFYLGLILIISILSCKLTGKINLPVLAGFILIGILLGTQVGFANMAVAESACNFALLFIIFTGGFQTDFKTTKPVLAVSTILASLGTVLTATLAAVFAYFILGLELHAAMLLGAVVSATDAASVFSVLNSKRLNLKNNLGSILEMESGTNDPIAYMLTVVFIALAMGTSQNVALLLFMQIFAGAAVGVVGGLLGKRLINHLNLKIDGVYAVLVIGLALLIYGGASAADGNGFLAVYIGGMIMSNGKLVYKQYLQRILGVGSMLMQVGLFVVLGVLFMPSMFVKILPVGIIFALFMFFIARPAVMTLIMKPFRYTFKEIAFISWAGLRGASSIVFSTYLLSAGLPYGEYVFSVVFFVCLLSVICQGSLLSKLANLFNLVAPEETKLKTIEEYTKEAANHLLEVAVPEHGIVCNQPVSALGMPENVFIVMIKRAEKYLVPNDATIILAADTLVIASEDVAQIKFLSDVL